jgi:hypothetical protein
LAPCECSMSLLSGCCYAANLRQGSRAGSKTVLTTLGRPPSCWAGHTVSSRHTSSFPCPTVMSLEPTWYGSKRSQMPGPPSSLCSRAVRSSLASRQGDWSTSRGACGMKGGLGTRPSAAGSVPARQLLTGSGFSVLFVSIVGTHGAPIGCSPEDPTRKWQHGASSKRARLSDEVAEASEPEELVRPTFDI